MFAFERLQSLSLIECGDEEIEETNNVTWRLTYPSLSSHLKAFIESRFLVSSHIDNHKIVLMDSYEFVFYHLSETWIYMMQQKKSNRRVCLVLLAKDFHPSTYSKMLVTLARAYNREPKLQNVVHNYLNIMIDNRMELDGSLLDMHEFDGEDALSDGQIRCIIELFHLDIILIYTALLLKRRIAIYHHSPQVLLDFVQALPAFIPHRKLCLESMLVPNVDLACTQLTDQLKHCTHYIATFVDAQIEKREELYDLYINLAAVEITISHNARSVFTMTKTHKDVAVSLVRAVESDSSNNHEIVSEICRKTYEILNVLYAFIGCTISPSSCAAIHPDGMKVCKLQLKEKLSSQTLLDFYWNLAIAEGLAQPEE